jgi:hypothetical protein
MSNELREEISRALAGQNDPNARAYGAAVVILGHHLGDDFIAKKVAHSEQPDSFLLNDLRPEASTRQTHMTRVTELADFLFALDGTPGFNNLLNRLCLVRAVIVDSQWPPVSRHLIQRRCWSGDRLGAR